MTPKTKKFQLLEDFFSFFHSKAVEVLTVAKMSVF
jgi:hypothetical protein